MPYGATPVRTGTNGFAIAALVVSLVSCGIGSILGIVFGAIARRQIRESGGAQGGDGLAIAGLVIGCVGLGVVATVIVFAIIGDSA